MSNREVKIELDGGRTATVRGYVNSRMYKVYKRMLLGGRDLKPHELEDMENMTFNTDDVLDAMEYTAKALLIEYCGNTKEPFEALMDSEYPKDTDIIEQKTQEIFGKVEEVPKK